MPLKPRKPNHVLCNRCGGRGTVSVRVPNRGCCGNIDIFTVDATCPNCKGEGGIDKSFISMTIKSIGGKSERSH